MGSVIYSKMGATEVVDDLNRLKRLVGCRMVAIRPLLITQENGTLRHTHEMIDYPVHLING